MYTLGIDIGSTTSKCVILRDGWDIAAASLVRAGIGTDGQRQAVQAVFENGKVSHGEIAASAVTGYGRNTYKGADMTVSELTCHAVGAHMVFPGVRTVIDIGGQDAKVIRLDENGKMLEFVMNDKCAAGTGRFLDVMSAILRVPVGSMEKEAVRADAPAKISSTCTVFAESEVISQLSGGISVPNVVAGICNSVAGRVSGLAKRISIIPDVCMSGGVAQNGGVRTAMSIALNAPVLYSEKAQLFGALGAARYAFISLSKDN